MNFIWYVTELNNRNHWGGTFVGFNQGYALRNNGHSVIFADPISDFVFLIENNPIDWVYVPVEFTQYPVYKNILHHKNSYGYKIIIGVGIFENWVKTIDSGDIFITQWYGPGVDKFPIEMHYVPHGYNPKLHKPVEEMIKYNIVFVGRNQPKIRNPKKYLYKLKNVQYFGYGWIYPSEKVKIDTLNKVYNQAIVCPNFHGDHQKGEFRMLNERTYQILASGGFQVCDYIPGIEKKFPEASLVTEKTPKKWVKSVNYFINNPKERKPFILNGLSNVKKYSYENIMQDFLKLLK